MASLITVQSKFQNIRVDLHPFIPGEFIVYLDDSWQLDTSVEFRYHESIATLPICLAESATRVLVCGGGDGMSVREALRFRDVQSVDLCEIDPAMIEIFKDKMPHLNQASLHDERVSVVMQDAVEWAKSKPENSYDVIILDFPSPTAQNQDKGYKNLFTTAVWDNFFRLLHPRGVICSQASIKNNLLVPLVRRFFDLQFRVYEFDTYYDSRGNHDSFIVASRAPMRPQRSLPENLRFLTNAHVDSILESSCELTQADLRHYQLFSRTAGIEHDVR